MELSYRLLWSLHSMIAFSVHPSLINSCSKQMNIFLSWSWKFEIWWFLMLPKPAKCDLLALTKLPNFKTFSISMQFSVAKIQIFSFKKEKMFVCLEFWQKHNYLLTKTCLYIVLKKTQRATCTIMTLTSQVGRVPWEKPKRQCSNG